MSFTALLANADAATFNLLRSGWFIPSDDIGRIVDRTLRRRSEARPAMLTMVLGEALLQLVSREEVEPQLHKWLDQSCSGVGLVRPEMCSISELLPDTVRTATAQTHDLVPSD